MGTRSFLKAVEARGGMAALRGLNAVAVHCPYPMVAPLGRALGRMIHRTSSRYRNVALKNLRFVYENEKTDEQIRDLARQVFEHFGQVAVEFFWLQRVRKKKLLSLVDLRQGQYLDKALEAGTGALVITAHYGNWELLGRVLVASGYPLTVVARDSDDPTQAGFINGIRQRGGLGIISRGEPASRLLEALKENQLLGILPDQNTIESPVFVPFFGKLASTAPGVALLALRTGCPVIPGFAVREGRRWRLEAEDPVELPTEGRLMDRILKVTADYSKVIEEQIRRRPEQWLWFHDRWRRRPEEGEAIYEP